MLDTLGIIMHDNSMIKPLTVSDQLRGRRQALGLSLSEVARRAGTSAATLSRYEHNWARFEVYTLRKLAVALDCELEIRFCPKVRRKPSARSREAVVEQLSRLFWDHPLTADDLDDHTVWVVERALEYGTLADVDVLRETLGREAFIEAVAGAHRLSPRTRNFWDYMLEMEGVTCTREYSRNTAWNY